MGYREFKHDPAELLRQGEKIVAKIGTAQKSDLKYKIRVMAVIMVVSGRNTAAQAAKTAGVNRVTVNEWTRTVDRDGFEALKDKKREGRRPKLSIFQLLALYFILRTSPRPQGYDIWSGITLSAYIKERFGIDYSVRSCQDLFHKLGLSYIRPHTFPSKGHENAPAREEFKKKLAEINEDESLIVVYEDEVHFQIQTSVTSGWYPTGSDPSLPSFPGHAKASYIGFERPKTGALFTERTEKFVYSSMISAIRDFLREDPPPEGKKYVIIWDNAPWHKKAMKEIESKEEYADIRENVAFLCLPPYSPDLNPIEQVWRITRKTKTHNRFFRSLAELVAAVEEAFAAWSVPNEQLRQLCKFG